MKVKKHVELESIHLEAIDRALPGVAISYILNELLYQLSLQLLDKPPNIAEYFKRAAEDSKDTLSI